MSSNKLAFVEVTGVDEAVASFYLEAAGDDLEAALSMFFTDQQQQQQQQQTAPATTTTTTAAAPAVAAGEEPRPKCGLFAGAASTPVPLKGLLIEAKVVGLVADCAQRFLFANTAEGGGPPLECTFRFGVAHASLYGVEVLTSDGRVVKGVLREKERAADDYDDGIASGHGAVLVEREADPLLGEALRMSVGNLPPGGSCAVVVRYVVELRSEGDTAILEFPNTYGLPLSRVPAVASIGGIGDGISAEITVVEGATSHVREISSELAISVQRVDDRTQKVVYHSDRSAQLLALRIGFDSANKAQVIAERDDSGDVVLLVSLVPHVETDEEIPSELIFLIDRSGSMAGSRINQVKNALQLFLRSIPENSRFNFVSFGSSFEKLFPESVPYTEETLARATEYVETMAANMQGTNVLPPLVSVLSAPQLRDFPRQIFFCTDGEVENADEVIAYVRKNAGPTRIFTFGISAEASPHLVNGIAAAAHGKAEFVPSGTRVEPKVMAQLQRALQPVLRHVEVDWGTLPSGATEQIPAALPPIFDGDHLIFYGKIGALPMQVGSAVGRITAQGGLSQTFEFAFEARFDDQVGVVSGNTIHRLAARAKISELESDPANKQQIVGLAKKYSLLTKYTSFVAVEERSVPTEGALVQRTVDAAALVEEREGKPVLVPVDAPEIGGIVEFPARAMLEDKRPQQLLFGSAPRRDLQEFGAFHRRRHPRQAQQQMERAEMLFDSFSAGDDYDEEEEAGGGIGANVLGEMPSLAHDFFGPMPTSTTASFAAPMQAPPGARFNAFAAQAPMAPISAPAPAAAPPPPPPPAAYGFFDSREAQQPQLAKRESSRQPQLVATAQTRLVDRIVFLQSSDGSWKSLEQLAGALGKDAAALRAGMSAGVPESVWATLLALEALKALCSETRLEWELLAAKARRWLARQQLQDLSSATEAASGVASRVFKQ